MLSIVDVMKSFEGYIRPYREAEEYLESGFLVCFGIKSRTENTVDFEGLAIQTSHVHLFPHKLTVSIDTSAEKGSQVKSTTCSCKAGESHQCKHIVAALLHLGRLVPQ